MKKRNIEKMFEASLFIDTPIKESSYDLSKEDLSISKYAAINIYQPTQENIEMFVRRYTLNELAFYPKIVNVRVEIIPIRYNTNKPEYLEEAQGTVFVTIEKVVLELPFMIVDGELVPFDIIRLDKQRVPYSRENLKKIMYGISNKEESSSPVKEFEPFLKLDNRVNPSSSIGFLGDVLRIRDQYANRTSGGNMFVTSSHIDTALEKLAKLTPLANTDMKNMEYIVKEAFVKREVEQFTKEANELSDSDDGNAMMLHGQLKGLPFVDAASLPHGSIVSFPVVDEHEVSINQGIIIDKYMTFANVKAGKAKILLTQDGKMKILGKDRLLCIRINGTGFRIHHSNLDTVQENDIIVAFDGDKALYPCVVDRISNKGFTKSEELVFDKYMEGGIPQSTALGKSYVRIYRLSRIESNDRVASVFGGEGLDEFELRPDNLDINLTTLEKAKFYEIPYDEFITLKAKEVGLEEMQVSQALPMYSVCLRKEKCLHRSGKVDGTRMTGDTVFCTDSDTNVIIVKGVIKGYLQDVKDLQNMASHASEFDLYKSAAQTEYIEIRKTNADKDLYDMAVKHMDKTNKLEKMVNRKFTAVPYANIREILKSIGYALPKIQEIMARAKSESFVHYELPADATPEKLSGGQMTGPITEIMKKIKHTIFDSNISDALAAELLGTILAGAMIGVGAGGGLFNSVKKFASESKALSIEFEKLAQLKKSAQMLEVAKLMATNSMLQEKVANVLMGTQYLKLNDVVSDIVNSREYLEKTAGDLMQLKMDQYQNKAIIANPGHIQAAINQIDIMFKTASTMRNYIKLKTEKEVVAETL